MQMFPDEVFVQLVETTIKGLYVHYKAFYSETNHYTCAMGGKTQATNKVMSFDIYKYRGQIQLKSIYELKFV